MDMEPWQQCCQAYWNWSDLVFLQFPETLQMIMTHFQFTIVLLWLIWSFTFFYLYFNIHRLIWCHNSSHHAYPFYSTCWSNSSVWSPPTCTSMWQSPHPVPAQGVWGMVGIVTCSRLSGMNTHLTSPANISKYLLLSNASTSTHFPISPHCLLWGEVTQKQTSCSAKYHGICACIIHHLETMVLTKVYITDGVPTPENHTHLPHLDELQKICYQRVSLSSQRKYCPWMVLRFDSSKWPVDPWPTWLGSGWLWHLYCALAFCCQGHHPNSDISW